MLKYVSRDIDTECGNLMKVYGFKIWTLAKM